MQKQIFKKQVIFQLIFASIIFLFSFQHAQAYGAPNYLPDGPHPRIWLTPSLVAELKAKRAANTTDWQSLVSREGIFNAYINNQPYRLDWPGGAGYAGSGYQDAIMTWGLMYYAYKTDAYGTISETADDVVARGYATKAVNMLNAMITYYSSGEEQDGIDLIRMNDRLYMFNTDEKAINAALTSSGTPSLAYRGGQTRLLTYKNGYAARTTAMVLPIAYDWFHDDPLLTPELKTTLYKIMFRHVDWFRGVRSEYNNGILIGGVRYYEDKDGDCTGANNCNINDTSGHEARRQKGYSYGTLGANFYESFVGTTMLIPLAVYGDAPQSDVDNYLDYAKTLWSEHETALSSETGFKGGDSPEGIYYNSSWKDVLAGALALKTATNEDIFAGFSFPKEMALNLIHNTYSSLNNVFHRGAWSSGQPAYWMTPVAQGFNIVSHVLRNYYGEPDESRKLQSYFNTAVFPGNFQGQAWERFLWRDDSHSASMPISSEPLFYHSVGTGVVTMRSSWSNSPDTFLSQISLKGNHRTDHESYDDGNILISRGFDRLLSRLKYVNGQDEENAVGQNTIVFNEANSLPGPVSDPNFMKPLSVPSIDRVENLEDYLFVHGEVSNAWKYNSDLFSGQNLAKLFHRNILYLRPNMTVVYDVTRSNPLVGNVKYWYMQFEANPVIDSANRNVSATIGNSKIFVKGLFPTGGSYSTADLSASSHSSVSTAFFRTKYIPTLTQEYDQFLHVIEATGSTDSQTPAILIEGEGGRGALIGNPGENIIAMFTSDQNGADMMNLSYSANTSTTSKHIITSLAPNQAYDVKIDSGNPAQYVASAAGIIEFENQSAGSHSYEISEHVANATPPAAPTGLGVM